MKKAFCYNPKWRWLVLSLVAVLLVALFAGCAATGPSRDQLNAQLTKLGDAMASIEQMTPADRKTFDEKLDDEGDQASPKDKEVIGRTNFLRGYIAESGQQYDQASGYYLKAIQSIAPYNAQASYRVGLLYSLHQVRLTGDEAGLVKNGLMQTVHSPDKLFWVRTPALAGLDGAASVSTKDQQPSLVLATPEAAKTPELLDTLYKSALGGWWPGGDKAYYAAAHWFVQLFKSIPANYGTAVALILLALIVKLVTMPFTTASFKGMRDMARIQPHLKEIQEKYKGDQARLAEETKKIWTEHKVNPAGGCLPMLIQLPIFFIVYHAVQVYSYGFANSKFIWIHNLAAPDLILLVLYLISMIITQKLTATPATDPQQKMMQNQMTYMMPFMLFIFLRSIASAFVLYWFFLNVFSAIHQYYLTQKFKQEDAAAGVVIEAKEVPAKKGKKS